MFTEEMLSVVRRAYAKQVMAAAQRVDQRLEEAFAGIPREFFLGQGPWDAFRRTKYVPTPTDDPVYLYVDEVFGLKVEEFINNGRPSMHAALISYAAPREGDFVVHIGAGTGYYTSIFSRLVGKTGRVIAYEVDDKLASAAKCNLGEFSNVEVVHGDGTELPTERISLLYINAGVTTLLDRWLDSLLMGGRLIVPLTVTNIEGQLAQGREGRGLAYCITRKPDRFDVRCLMQISIIHNQIARDPESERLLRGALRAGYMAQATRLDRDLTDPNKRYILKQRSWAFSL